MSINIEQMQNISRAGGTAECHLQFYPPLPTEMQVLILLVWPQGMIPFGRPPHKSLPASGHASDHRREKPSPARRQVPRGQERRRQSERRARGWVCPGAYPTKIYKY
jgi:hypothetical protein